MSNAPIASKKQSGSRRRWLICGAILVVCIILGKGLYYFFTPASFYEKAAHQLKGMTSSEVDAKLGRPYEFEYSGGAEAKLQYCYYHLKGAASPLILSCRGGEKDVVNEWCIGPVGDRVCHPIE
jgi:hypothetical protein